MIMAKIIYKYGHEGENSLECIEGIEISLLNRQHALIYPKYAERILLEIKMIDMWTATEEVEIEALKQNDSLLVTRTLWKCGSPAAEFVSLFRSNKHDIFALPTLLAAMEIADQKKDIDELAKTIEGADLLRNFTSYVWSCSRYNEDYG